jgi:rod shape-determining protein MreC
MIDFLQRHWGHILLIILIIVAVAAMVLVPDEWQLTLKDGMFSQVQVVWQPISSGINTVNNWTIAQIQFFQRMDILNEKSINLERENTALRKEIKEVQQRDLELDRLRNLLALKQKTPIQTTAAEVIAVSPSSYYKTLIIDKGTQDGIFRNMVVINNDGLIGRILEVSPWSAKVLLIADQRSAVAVMVERTGTRAILEGEENGNCRLLLEDPQAQMKIGDRIVTSGIGGVFPKGLFVGIISYIQRDKRSGWATQIKVLPEADFCRVQEVLIITQPVIPAVRMDLKQE